MNKLSCSILLVIAVSELSQQILPGLLPGDNSHAEDPTVNWDLIVAEAIKTNASAQAFLAHCHYILRF